MTPKELAFLSGYSEQNITKTLAFSSGYIQKQAQDDPLFSDTAVLATGAGAATSVAECTAGAAGSSANAAAGASNRLNISAASPRHTRAGLKSGVGEAVG